MKIGLLSGAAILAAIGAPLSVSHAAQETPAYAQATETNAEIAQTYFDTYLEMDWDRIEVMLADEAQFSDPTGTPIFGEVLYPGKSEMVRLFRENYAPLKELSFAEARVLHSGAHSIFQGDLTWTLTLSDGTDVTSTIPIVSIIEVRDGKIVRHTDYADYRPFVAAMEQAREN